MKLSIGNDHAGTDYKLAILNHLESKGFSVINHGTNTKDSVDYPDFVHPVCNDIEQQKANFGILICGSANGVAMTANKHQDIRAGLCWTKEIAQLTRLHNNANVVCIPARFTAIAQAIEIVDVFLNTAFEGGRHLGRVNKIAIK